MSQNKTVIPGLEQPQSPYQGGGNPYGAPNGGQMPPQNNFYQRTQPSSARGTVVPGMTPQTEGAASQPQGQGPVAFVDSQPQRQRVYQTGKPVVGFLYSISRTAAGEFWPLYQGQNTIGKGPNCDIQLPEGTVSQEHAVVMVRKMKNPEKVIASVTDARSTNGTMLNGQSLGFSAEECKNGDIITIGDNYELYLVLIDPASLGLKVSEKFINVELEEDEDGFVDEGPSPFMQDAHQRPTRQGDGFGAPMYDGGGYVPSNGTVGLDGSTGGFGGKGGTVAY